MVTSLMNAAQVVAAARPPALDPVIPLTLVWTEVTVFELAERAAALAFRAAEVTEQAAMEATASSSYFLHLENASLQDFRPAAMLAVLEILQLLT